MQLSSVSKKDVSLWVQTGINDEMQIIDLDYEDDRGDHKLSFNGELLCRHSFADCLWLHSEQFVEVSGCSIDLISQRNVGGSRHERPTMKLLPTSVPFLLQLLRLPLFCFSALLHRSLQKNETTELAFLVTRSLLFSKPNTFEKNKYTNCRFICVKLNGIWSSVFYRLVISVQGGLFLLGLLSAIRPVRGRTWRT